MPGEVLYKEIGRRIKRARETLKISQEELARKLGYNSPATISYYESGERKISIADLQRIAAELGLKVDDLLNDNINEPASFVFRAAEEVRPAARNLVGGFLTFAQKNGREPLAFPADWKVAAPRKGAAALLKMLEVTQPPVLPHLVAEQLNVPVFDWNFPDEISGIFVRYRSFACIGVNEQHPYVRQRFTIAHEIGHHILDETDGESIHVDFVEGESVSRKEEKKRQEVRANQFAADLLMPKDWLYKDFKNLDRDVTVLAKRYDVSEQALWFRLLALKLVDTE